MSLQAQQHYRVVKLPFNSSQFNEMAPVFYKNGIVFSSNEKSNVLVVTYDQNNNYPYHLYYVEKKGKKWGRPELLSKNITSFLNESSATFSDDYRVMYYTQNLMATEKLSQVTKEDSIRMGIFQANETGKDWTLTQDFPFNDQSYDVVFPSLSDDGKQLFFCSKKPGGYGNYDIYVTILENGKWSEPKNLGPIINTRENEVFPFLHPDGRLYFSSRGHNSQGGLDIFFAEKIDGKWITPVNLPKPFNSRQDDFSYVLSGKMDTGFFASNRQGTDDVYMFMSSFPSFKECPQQVNEKFCYEYNETGSLNIDTTSLNYEWNFGDGMKERSVISHHCYSKPGKYNVSLNVIDTLTGEVYYSEATYELAVEPLEQAYINVPDTVFTGQKIKLDGRKSIIKTFEPTTYYWDFGDGIIEMGLDTEHTFAKPGKYYIRLGVASAEVDPEKEQEDYSNRTCSQKPILVIKNTQK